MLYYGDSKPDLNCLVCKYDINANAINTILSGFKIFHMSGKFTTKYLQYPPLFIFVDIMYEKNKYRYSFKDPICILCYHYSLFTCTFKRPFSFYVFLMHIRLYFSWFNVRFNFLVILIQLFDVNLYLVESLQLYDVSNL